MTDLVVNEVVESKVSKSEMIEMIMAEEEAVISERLIAIESRLMSHLDFQELQSELSQVYKDVLTKKHKDIAKLFAKFGSFRTSSWSNSSGVGAKLGLFKIAYNSNPANNSHQTYAIGTITVSDHFTITSTKMSSYMKLLLNGKSPALTTYLKKLAKIEKEQAKFKLEADTLRLQLQKIRSSTKLVKARLTRNLLESTAEGRLMLKKLEKVKGKVVGQLMINQ